MKLRNKKTGEIGELMTENYEFDGFWVRTGGDNCPDYKDINYYSLAELNEEWENYEESKEYWFVDSGGEVEEATYLTDNDKSSLRNFGNYFETREEAEKAVEKLRAWKRLKDLGFKCSYHSRGYHWGTFTADFIFDEDKLPIMNTFVAKDLDLLFGGKE